MEKLSVEAFLARPLQPLTFYNILPTDGRVERGSSATVEIEPLVDLLLQFGSDVVESDLDLALTSLIVNPARLDARLKSAADHMSWLYAELLSVGLTARSRRMKVQLINFCVRDLIDRDTSSGRATSKFHGVAPWDWLSTKDGELTILSGANGLKWDGACGMEAYSAGMPSQLDDIDGESVSVGSIFSPGAYLFRRGELTRVECSEPIVLIFNWNEVLSAVTYGGKVRPLSGKNLEAQLSVSQVDRARVLGDILIVSDWTKPHRVICYDLKNGLERERFLSGIILLNDICSAGDGYFAVCKQQGRIFAYDRNFQPRGEALSFGRRDGCMFDPICIRNYDDALHVLNWVTGSKTVVPMRGLLA